MTKDYKKENQDGFFEDIVDDLEEIINHSEPTLGEKRKNSLANNSVEQGKSDESFEEIATDLAISISEHERLDKKEEEQEARRFNHQERAKVLTEQERRQDEKEAQLVIKEREQRLREQALKEREERQRREAKELADQDESNPALVTVFSLFLLVIVFVGIFSGGDSSTSKSGSSYSHNQLNRNIEIYRSPIDESDYTLGEDESVYPWTFEEFETISIPNMLLMGNSNFTLDQFVEKYGLASKAEYTSSSQTYDMVSLTYSLSEIESLRFSFMYRDSRYLIFFKDYEGYENSLLSDYWKDKEGKSWSIADYNSLSTGAEEGDTLEQIISTFGAPASYKSSVTSSISISDFYTLSMDYPLEDGSIIRLSFSSNTDDPSSYRLSNSQIKEEDTIEQ